MVFLDMQKILNREYNNMHDMKLKIVFSTHRP